jgi:two-component system, sensor histidine kinase and response regulator
VVNNAVKFTERGEIVVSVAFREKAQEGTDLLCFTVRDTGIGLSADQIAGLFQAFSQADTHTSRKYGGTGLGLAICKQLVEMMGGRIWATSEPGQGSVFSFTIKAKSPADASLTPRADRKQLPELAARRVLIVDDSASARDILAMMARGFGMDTKAAPSGGTALDMLTQASLQNAPFDLVLMDWRMPGMDGLEAARLIKADSSLRRTPAVLMVTAFAREEILRRAEQLGLEGVLIKPVTESVLFNTIAEALGCGRPDDQPTEKELRRDLSLLRGRHILLVDDDASNREVATIFLERVEMIVETAMSGAEAIARMQASRYDIVLMDSRMPDMDGLTVTRMLRQDPRFRLTPILALTANAHPSDRSAGLDAGMNDYLTKPVDTDQLYDALLL